MNLAELKTPETPAQPWFDNQAGTVDFVKGKERLENLTVDRLKEKLLETNQQIAQWVDLYNQTKCETFVEKLTKLNRFRCALQINITRLRRNGDDPAYAELKEQKALNHQLHNQLQQELPKLRKAVSILEKEKSGLAEQIGVLQKGIRNQKQKTINVQNATHRNIRIHNVFKELVKSELGTDKYVELITKADQEHTHDR